MQPNFKFSLGNYISLGGCLITLICVFLPYASVTIFGMTESTSLISGGDGWFFLILAIAVAAANVFSLTVPNLGLSIVTALLTIFEIIDFSKNSLGIIERSVGFYFMIIGAVAMLAGAILLFIQQRKSNQ